MGNSVSVRPFWKELQDSATARNAISKSKPLVFMLAWLQVVTFEVVVVHPPEILFPWHWASPLAYNSLDTLTHVWTFPIYRLTFVQIIELFRFLRLLLPWPRSLKITEKVSFNIASGASYVQVHFEWTKVRLVNLTSFWKPKACGLVVLPERSIIKGQ